MRHTWFKGLPVEMRARLVAAVPAEHKDFLRELQWVHEQPVAWGAATQLVCVHAGLDKDKPLEAQLAALRRRDLADPVLYDKPAEALERIEAFSARGNFFPPHPESAATCVTVSGHHGVSFEHGHRIVFDRSGGKDLGEHPLEALLLPEREALGHDGQLRKLSSEMLGANVENNMKEFNKLKGV